MKKDSTMTRAMLTITTITSLLLLVLMTSLACGPADESIQKETGNLPLETGASPQETDPTPEPTANEYPNLDETLAEIVRKYELGELSEEEAAALAPEHEGIRVLVQVEAPADNVDALDTWMGEKAINPRYADPDYAWPLVYAYPRVSVLGALSQQDGVTLVHALKSSHPGVPISYPKPPLPVAKAADGTDLPELPGWLKGYPHPRSYHEYDGGALSVLMNRYDDGEVSDETIDSFDPSVGCGVDDGGRVSLALRVQNTAAALQTVRAWLAEREITEQFAQEREPGIMILHVYLRPSEIKAVVELVDVARAYFEPCGLKPGYENFYEYRQWLRD